MLTNFDLGQDGNIKLSPLTGISTAVAGGMVCLLRLEFPKSPEDLLAGRAENVQLALTPAQATEVADGLLKMAEIALRQDKTGPRN